MFFSLIVPLFLSLFYKPIAYLCGRSLNNKSKRENYFMKHISNFLRSKSWNVFLFLYLALPLFAQKEYKIDQVSVVNVGDGRLLFRELKTEKALNGEHRIIDGYHSAYVLASFKDGFYDGGYKEYVDNILITEGSYKEGRKDGLFKINSKFDGKLKEEKSYKEGKLDGTSKSYFTTGKVESERNFRMGKEHGKQLSYESDGTLRKEHNYKDGKQVGKQYTFLKGTYDLYETVYFNEEGLQDGEYSSVFTFGSPRILGSYKNGKKNGRWTTFAESGDTLMIETYLDGKEDGLHVSFANGSGVRQKEYYMKNDRKDGLYREYNLENGELRYEATYQAGRLHGKERRLIVSNRFDYWETSTYVNGRQNGPFEACYVKNDQLRECGEYKNGRRVGRWKRYTIDGKLEKEWDEN